MSKLERLNDWCGEVLDKAIRYDDLITFSFFVIMFVTLLTIIVIATLGMLGFFR